MSTKINVTELTPGQLAWVKLKKNKPALFGLFVIVVSAFLAITCYLFIPDNTPFCNTMCLPVSLQHPGFTAEFLKVPRPGEENKKGVERFLTGTPLAFSLVPLKKWEVHNGTIQYEEFTGDASIKGTEGTYSIASLASNNPKFNINNQSAEWVRMNLILKRTFLLGTDRFGRDLLSRLLLGTRVSLAVGFIAVFISLIIGVAIGAIAGYFRGWIDQLLQWFINVVWSIPTLLLVIAITMALGKGFAQVFIAVGLTMWVEVARLVRGQIFSLREQQFVEAGTALGYGHSRIIIRHILPNLIGPVIVVAASNFASAILLEAGLSFLGMGAQPPMPSWGMMIKENYSYIVVDAAYLALWPGAMIALMVLSFTLLGNGLRDAFDSRSTES
jgi:peptide/nickel transport system permease protein